MLFGLLPGASRAEQTQDAPVADAPAAETPLDAVPATQTPTETLEAETVSLSKNQVRVIKGGTTTLTAEIPEDQRGEASGPLTASSAVVWSSSNPEVATVDSSGVVTGIELGEATITATLNGTVIETFTVYSTLGDGYYVIGTLDYERYICTDELSMGNYVSMYALPMSAFEEDSTGLDEEIGRKWYIDYLGEGFYIIYPAYSTSMALCYHNMRPMVSPLGTTSTYARHWKITSGTIDYVIQNRADSSVYLEFTDPEEDYTSLDCAFYDSPSEAQNWCINSTLEPSGLLLFDTLTGNLIANSWNQVATSHIAYLPKDIPRSLANLGLYVQVLDPTEESTDYGMSFYSPTVTFNSTTQRITGTSNVSTIATISRTIYGTSRTVSFSLVVYSQTNSITVKYDEAYADRHSNEVSRINAITQVVTQKFATYYGIVLSMSSPSMFTSYGDECPYDNYNSECSCYINDICINAHNTPSDDADPLMHHKNAYNIFHYATYSSTQRILNFIGHDVCFQNLSGHQKNSVTDAPIYGIANVEKNLAQVHDHTDASSITHEACSTFHEVGHLFGAPDHYKTGRTTSDINILVSGGYFSDTCIYGAYRYNASVINSMTVCEGCRKAIKKEITIPASWFEGGSLS